MTKPIILAGLMVATLTSSALAHSKAETTTPANDATVESVEAIEVRFDDPMRVTAITVTGPDGEVAITRETGMDAVTEFRALTPADLPGGAYTVEWRGLSSDGHPISWLGLSGHRVQSHGLRSDPLGDGRSAVSLGLPGGPFKDQRNRPQDCCGRGDHRARCHGRPLWHPRGAYFWHGVCGGI